MSDAEQAAARLYKDARAALDAGDPKKAVKLFREVEDDYPYLDLARRAKLGVAYALFLEQDYEDSIDELNRFIAYHPVDKDIDYAYYLKAVNYYRQIPGYGRDTRYGNLTFDAFELFLKRYPDSEYASDASAKLREVADVLAANHLSIGRYYQDRDDLLAAINRFQLVAQDYPETAQAPEALHRLVECFAALGIVEEAVQTAQVLVSGYPGNDWADDSRTMLASMGVSGQALENLALEDLALAGEGPEAAELDLGYRGTGYLLAYAERTPGTRLAEVRPAAAQWPEVDDGAAPARQVGPQLARLEAPRSSAQGTAATDAAAASHESAATYGFASRGADGAASGFRFRETSYKATAQELALLDRWNQSAVDRRQDGDQFALEGKDGLVGYSLGFDGQAKDEASGEFQPEPTFGLTEGIEGKQSFAMRGKMSVSDVASFEVKNKLIEQRKWDEDSIGDFEFRSEDGEWRQNEIHSSEFTIGLFDDRLTSNTVFNTSRFTDSDSSNTYDGGHKFLQTMDLDVWRGEATRFSLFGAYGEIDEDYTDSLEDEDEKDKNKKKDPFSEPGQGGVRFGGTFGVGPADFTLSQTDSWESEDSEQTKKSEYETKLSLDLNELRKSTGELFGDTFWDIAPDSLYASYGFGTVDTGSSAATKDKTTDFSAGAGWYWDGGYGYVGYWYSYYDNKQPDSEDYDWAGDGLDFGGGLSRDKWDFGGWFYLSRSEQMGEYSEFTDMSLGGGLSIGYRPDNLPDMKFSLETDSYRADYIAYEGASRDESWEFTTELDFTKYWSDLWAPRPSNLGLVFQVRDDSAMENWSGARDRESGTDFFIGVILGIGMGESD